MFGLAVNPNDGASFGIRAGTGVLLRLGSGDPQPQPIGPTSLNGVRALAYDPTGNALFAVSRGGPGSDDVLSAVNPGTGAATTIGTITGFAGIEGLTFHGTGTAPRLLAVDATLDVLVELDKATGLATTVGALGAAAPNLGALASDASDGLLLGADSSGDVVSIDTTDGRARRIIRLAEGAMRGLAHVPTAGHFLGVAIADDKLHALDPKGSWIAWAQTTGLAADDANDTLYGVNVLHGLVFRADEVTGWRQPLAALNDAGLQGLARDASGPTLYALSSTTQRLYRVNPATGDVQTVGSVTGPGGPWATLQGLAFAKGSLYAVDTATSTVLQINPSTAAATVLTAATSHTGIQSLAYDPARDRLLAYADGTRSLLAIAPTLGAPVDVLSQEAFTSIGGLAWLAEARRLLGTDLTAGDLAIVEQLVVPTMGFDEVHALSLAWASQELTGFDNATARYLVIDKAQGAATGRGGAPGLAVEGLAHDALAVTTYAIDAASKSLYSVDPAGQFTRIGAAGALGAARDIRAIAFDPTTPPGTLYGYDNAARRLVTIDITTGAVADAGAVIAPTSIEALTWDNPRRVLLAIDRSTATLMEIDPSTGAPTPIAAPLAMSDIRGMAAMPGTDELFVVDASVDRIAIIDRFTGDVLEAFDEPERHRGADDAAVRMLWPRGKVRPEHLAGFALQVSAAYEDDGYLTFRRGTRRLQETRFRAELMITQRTFADDVRKILARGGKATWGLTYKDKKRKPDLVKVTVVPGRAAGRELAALAKNPYMRKQKSWVRDTRAARILMRHGFHSEALVRAMTALGAKKDYVPALREYKRARYGLFGTSAMGVELDSVIEALGKKGNAKPRETK